MSLSPEVTFIWMNQQQPNNLFPIQNQQSINLYHFCSTINEAKTKEEYLKQEEIKSQLCFKLQCSNIQIRIQEVINRFLNIEHLAIECQAKPIGYQREQNWYEYVFNQFIIDSFQIINYQIVHKISQKDENNQIIMDGIQRYNNQNIDVYIKVLRNQKLEESELWVEIYLPKKLSYNQLVDKVQFHQNKISQLFRIQSQIKINDEKKEKVLIHHTLKMLDNQSDVQISYDAHQLTILGEQSKVNRLIEQIENSLEKHIYYQESFQLNKIITSNQINLNVFKNKLKQISQKSKNSTIELLSLSSQMEFFIVCEPSQLSITKANIKNDFIDNLGFGEYEENLQDLLLFLDMGKDEFQLKYEVIIVFENAERYKLFGLSSSLKSIEKIIKPCQHKMFFENNVIFSEFQQLNQLEPCIQLPSKLEFYNDSSIRIYCKQIDLEQCITNVLNRVDNIKKKILTLKCNFDRKCIKYLKTSCQQFIASIQQNQQTLLQFKTEYELILGTGKPQQMQQEKQKLQLTNNGILNTKCDALINIGATNFIIDEIITNIQSMDGSNQYGRLEANSRAFLMPKDQKLYSFSYLFILGTLQNALINLAVDFYKFNIKSIAFVISEKESYNQIKEIFNFFLFAPKQSSVETVYIIETDLLQFTKYEKYIWKEFNLSQYDENNRQWEEQNVYEYKDVNEKISKQINLIFNQFQITSKAQKLEVKDENSKDSVQINIDQNQMTLMNFTKRTQNKLRMKSIMHQDQFYLESFNEQTLSDVHNILSQKIREVTIEKQLQIPNLTNDQFNNFKKYLQKKSLSLNGQIECNKKIIFYGFERHFQKVLNYLSNLTVKNIFRVRAASVNQQSLQKPSNNVEKFQLNETSEIFQKIKEQFKQQNLNPYAIISIKNKTLTDNYTKRKNDFIQSYQRKGINLQDTEKDRQLWTSNINCSPQKIYQALIQGLILTFPQSIGQAFCLSDNPSHFINSCYEYKDSDQSGFTGRKVLILCQVTTGKVQQILENHQGMSPIQNQDCYVSKVNQNQVFYLKNQGFFRILPKLEVIF